MGILKGEFSWFIDIDLGLIALNLALVYIEKKIKKPSCLAQQEGFDTQKKLF